MKGFYISVSNGLIEDKHRVAMGEAIWLYMLLLDKITSVTEAGVGKVLGGKPLRYEDILEFYPLLPRRTYVRYVVILRTAGYIDTIRTPRGVVFKVLKAKKIFNGDAPKTAQRKHDDVSNMAQQKTSDAPNMAIDAPKTAQAEDAPKTAQAIKTRQSRQDKDKTSNNVEVQKNIRLVYELYLEKFEKNPNQNQLSKARYTKIKARLKDAGLEMLKTAIINTADSPFHRGDNPRGWQANLDFIIRSYEQVEKLAELETKSTSLNTASRPPTREEIDRALGYDRRI